MNLRRLRYFVKIVDLRNLTHAAEALHIAQPALSQQLAVLESEMDQKLLIRSSRGVTVTEAGQTLYRHAQTILRQCDDARRDVNRKTGGLTGSVTLGLAPGRIAAQLALPIVTAVRAQIPGVMLSLAESFGSMLGEHVLSGRADLAVLYDNERGLHGLNMFRIAREPLAIVAVAGELSDTAAIPLTEVGKLDLFLPRPPSAARQVLDEALAKIGLHPHVIGEIESPATLQQVISTGLGAAVLPESMAKMIASNNPDLRVWKLTEPDLKLAISVCTSSYLPLSEQAKAVLNILLDKTPDLFDSSEADATASDPFIAQRLQAVRNARKLNEPPTTPYKRPTPR